MTKKQREYITDSQLDKEGQKQLLTFKLRYKQQLPTYTSQNVLKQETIVINFWLVHTCLFSDCLLQRMFNIRLQGTDPIDPGVFICNQV